MYPLSSLTAELQSASRRLLDVFEVPHSKASGERRPQGMRNGLQSIGRLTHMKSLVYSCVPPCVLKAEHICLCSCKTVQVSGELISAFVRRVNETGAARSVKKL
jgi:hypothetical protein